MAVLAPTDEAIDRLGEIELDFLRSDGGREALESILSYHVLLSVLPTTVLLEGSTMTVPSLYQDRAVNLLKESSTSTLVNGVVRILEADILANNGIVHLVDDVLSVPVTRAPAVASTVAPTTDISQLGESSPGPTPQEGTGIPTFSPSTVTGISTSVPTTNTTIPNVTDNDTEAASSFARGTGGDDFLMGVRNIFWPAILCLAYLISY